MVVYSSKKSQSFPLGNKEECESQNHPPEDAVDDEVDAAVDGDEEVVALGQSCHLQTKVLK